MSEATACPAGVGENRARVLALDDEQAIRKMYQSVLTECGCHVETAENGREALRILLQKNFDVLVVDLNMPEMDGFTFLEEALKIWPWIGVVIVSGYVNGDALRRADALGITRVLHKPVGYRDLCDTVLSAAGPRDTASSALSVSALSCLCDHLRLLARLSERAIGTKSVLGALHEIGTGLSDLLPCDCVGVLGIQSQEEEHVLVLNTHTEVRQEFLDGVKKEMLIRYQGLSGKTLDPEKGRVELDGASLSETGIAQVGSTLSVPILLEQEITGLVTLAAAAENAYSSEDVCLLYHAANHISGIFAALNGMRRLATQDPLTGALNRMGLEETLERTWLISRRYGFSMAVVVVDIDHFKTLNDSYGHAVGDQALREFSKVIESVTRASDIVARYGGDEFVAILPAAHEVAVRTFGDRLLQATRQRLFCEDTLRLKLTISVGVSTSTNPTAPATSGALLNQADRALYMAKRAGRDRMCVWPGQTSAPAGSDAPPTPEEKAVVVAKSARILVVDDEAPVRNVISLMLKRENYEVVTFETGQEALDAITAAGLEPFDLLLTDLRLPGMGGLELLEKIDNMNSPIVKIVMTGFATVDNAVTSLREGAYDFIQKPVDRGHLLAVVKRALEFRDLKIENARYQARLEELVRDRSAQLAESLEEVKKSYEFTLEAMVAMLDAREKQTARHGLRVRDLAVRLGQFMQMRGDALEMLARGALLHDLGKISVPDAVLLKPSSLTTDEWKIMRKHAETGYRILASSVYLRNVAEIVYSHHERYDGGGYPRGLRGEEICLGARIFSVVDAYEAMRSTRVYRQALPPDVAGAEILKHSGTQFDPAVVEIFMQCQDEMEAQLARG